MSNSQTWNRSVWTRREVLRALGALAIVGATPRTWAAPRSGEYPFSLGVASGYPRPDGAVLWTRLAPRPLEPGGGMVPLAVPVRWEVARDEGFQSIAASGTAYADPEWAHSVHVEPAGLEPDRMYWYRFHAGEATSPVGRTRTAPALGALPGRLRLGVGSCQHYEQGLYAAYRHAVADDLDLFLHVGDYIYESAGRADGVRQHGLPEPVTLEDYRTRFALYKTDPDLQAAHASCPWLVVWDDHELENDYAGDRSENDDDPAWFLLRRAAAYKAYYEHMPLRRQMVPLGPNMRIYTRVRYGQLADFHLLDDRQYRTYQPCPAPGQGGSNVVGDCAERLDPRATLLGERQERWLAAGLDASKARWNLLGQQTLMAQADCKGGPGQVFGTDCWDGYPAARRRLLGYLAERRPANPVVLGGDLHSYWVADLKPDFDDERSPTVASEFVTTSITSHPPPESEIRTVLSEGPHFQFATGTRRGYLRLDLTPERLTADMRALTSVQTRDSACETLASFVVEDGRPGPRPA
jgi:alkaline phosphatase D